MRPCFTFKAQTSHKPAVLAIDDEIGFWGVQARDFRAGLDAVQGDNLSVEINSPGGDVFAGLGMYNMLRNFAASGKTVTTKVTGVAASIASIIMLAGDKREMPKNSFAMIHAPMTVAAGTAAELRDTADTVDKIGASLRGIYVDRMGVTSEAADTMMSKDTWLTAEECLTNGFATDLTDAVVATARFDMARADLPANVKAVFKATDPTPEEIAAKEKADADTAEAARLVAEEAAKAAANPVADQIAARAKVLGVEAHTLTFALSCSTMAEAEVRMSAAREIMALCALAKRPKDAAAHIKANADTAAVCTALINAQAKCDVNTDGTQKVVDQNTSPGAVSPTDIWAKHHANRANRTNNQQSDKKGR